MNRRVFLGTSVGPVAGTVLTVGPAGRRSVPAASDAGHSVHVRVPDVPPGSLLTLYDPQVKALVLTALDAAKNAGATYADVQLTYTIGREWSSVGVLPHEIFLGMNVRALVQGYWGWAATPYLSAQEAPRVGREAAHLATLGAAQGLPRTVDWGTLPAIPDGQWHTPIRIDPLEVRIEEIVDFCEGINTRTDNLIRFRSGAQGRATTAVAFGKTECILASTEGTYVTQTVHAILFTHTFSYKGENGVVDLHTVQGGWEHVLAANVPEHVLAELDRIDRLPPPLPVKKDLNLGQYDILFTGWSVAALLQGTLVPATELDRALGYEANGVGTSYLGPDPLTQLGTQVASPLITLSADRSDPLGVTTTQWDDDGMVPSDFTVIKKGVLMDYQTTREQAPWLAPWYQRQGVPIRSHGCASSKDALWYPMQQTPNITLQPGTAPYGEDELLAGMEHGLVVDGTRLSMDWQCASGIGFIGNQDGIIYEVRHGRRVARMEHGVWRQIMFRSSALWKNVVAIGGAATAERYLLGRGVKGEPPQDYQYSLATVPIVVTDVAVAHLQG